MRSPTLSAAPVSGTRRIPASRHSRIETPCLKFSPPQPTNAIPGSFETQSPAGDRRLARMGVLSVGLGLLRWPQVADRLRRITGRRVVLHRDTPLAVDLRVGHRVLAFVHGLSSLAVIVHR